jgi:uncharacterized membrane protein YeaQ/YmgE (transglycosylase-associated protein family)
MNLLITILIGTAMGVLVELLFPGHTKSELLLAVLLGVAGALLARFAGTHLGLFGSEEPQSFLASAAAAIAMLICYGVFLRVQRRRGKR